MKQLFLIVPLVLLPATTLTASPATGRDLVATCERALAGDFKGMEAAMCEWYVRPCEICGVDKPPPTHCVPEDMPVRDLAARVIADLRSSALLLGSPAKDAVEKVLAARYPCGR